MLIGSNLITQILSIPLPCSSQRNVVGRGDTGSKTVFTTQECKALLVNKEGFVTKKLG